MREDEDLRRGHAAGCSTLESLSLARPGYQRSKRGRSVPSRARARVCNSRRAPRGAGAVPLTIVDQAADVAGDVDGELMRCATEFAEVWVVHLQRIDIVLEEADRLQGG